MTIMPLELVFGLHPENFLGRLLQRILIVFTALMPGLFGYQLFSPRKKNGRRSTVE